MKLDLTWFFYFLIFFSASLMWILILFLYFWRYYFPHFLFTSLWYRRPWCFYNYNNNYCYWIFVLPVFIYKYIYIYISLEFTQTPIKPQPVIRLRHVINSQIELKTTPFLPLLVTYIHTSNYFREKCTKKKKKSIFCGTNHWELETWQTLMKSNNPKYSQCCNIFCQEKKNKNRIHCKLKVDDVFFLCFSPGRQV